MTEPNLSPGRVTVIGLGAMGTALAESFISAGHTTTVWNRTAAKADALVAKGGLKAASVEDAVRASRLVVICVSDYNAVADIVGGIADFEQRSVLNVTSGGATAAREIASTIHAQNGLYLDGAIMAMTSEIGPDESGMIFCSGSEASWADNESTLAALGSGVQYLGEDAGLTGLYDLAALNVTWSVVNAFLHSAALFETADQSPKSMLPLIEKTLRNVAEWLPGYADQIETGVISPDGDIRGSLLAMNNLLDESTMAGINTDLPQLLTKLAGQAVADGDGGEGYPAIVRQFRKPSPSKST